MANLTENPVYEAGIYRFETTDPVQGGPGGIDNLPTNQLANRTAWLKAQVEAILLDIAAIESGYATAASLAGHTGNTSNPHAVTKAQVGLGSVLNYGIATQAEAEAGTIDTKYMTPLRAKQAINLHTGNTSNPHAVTKSQVGLGSVENYGVATQAEAEAGTSTTKYMTPLRAKQAIAALVPAASETTAGLIERATAAEAQAMSDGLRALTPALLAAALQGGNQSLSANGYQRLPGGLIIQWGQFNTGAVGNNAGGSHTFALAFPAAALQVVAGTTAGTTAGVSGSEGFAVTAITSAGFSWQSLWNAHADTDGAIRYIAIGY